MLDATLRPFKDAALARPARRLGRWVSPGAVTAAALAAGLAAAGMAGRRLYGAALALWLVGRLLDGLDGAVARQRGRADDLGAYLDMVADTLVYAAIPLGIAVGVDERATWIAAGFLLASFYVNSVSWTYLSAVLEKRGQGAITTGESTAITMPPALIEGTETIVFFTLFLLVPGSAPWTFSVMAVLVGAGVGQRVVWARRLRAP